MCFYAENVYNNLIFWIMTIHSYVIKYYCRNDIYKYLSFVKLYRGDIYRIELLCSNFLNVLDKWACRGLHSAVSPMRRMPLQTRCERVAWESSCRRADTNLSRLWPTIILSGSSLKRDLNATAYVAGSTRDTMLHAVINSSYSLFIYFMVIFFPVIPQFQLNEASLWCTKI